VPYIVRKTQTGFALVAVFVEQFYLYITLQLISQFSIFWLCVAFSYSDAVRLAKMRPKNYWRHFPAQLPLFPWVEAQERPRCFSLHT